MIKKAKNKKVVILDNLNNDSIEQAIFIMKEGVEADQDYIVHDAQKIIDNFLYTTCISKTVFKVTPKFIWLVSSISFVLITIATYILFRI